MVQVLKEELKNSILEIARAEFIKNGYAKASMRSIAKKSNVSLSNIYNYFENKDAIFEAVVEPTKCHLDTIRENLKTADSNYLKFDKAAAYFDEIVDFLDENKENLNLLAFASHGSRFENYIDEWVDFYGKFEYKALKEKAKGHKGILRKMPSEFFIKNLSCFFFKAVLELTNKRLSRKSLEPLVKEVFSFVYQGWDIYLAF